jgi:hypothetical protein
MRFVKHRYIAKAIADDFRKPRLQNRRNSPIRIRARLQKLRRNSDSHQGKASETAQEFRLVSGHGFSRAVSGSEERALAPEEIALKRL